MSPEAKDLVKKLLEKNRQKRPSLEETLQHKWYIQDTGLHEQRVGTNKDKNGLDNKFEVFTITDSKDNKRFEDID